MNYPKILVACPTYDGKDYIIDQWVAAVKSLDYPNFEWLIVDNSKGSSYTRKLRERGYKVVHVHRGSNSREALSNAQNLIRKKVLDEGFDYWLSLESDLLPPKDIIGRLLSHGKPVVGSVYFLGVWEGIQKPPCLFVLDKKNPAFMGTRMLSPKEGLEFIGHGLRPIHGCGLGCTLISKSILERFCFWTDTRFDNKHSDVYFFMELQNTGIQVFVDSDIIVNHYPSNWDLVKDR